MKLYNAVGSGILSQINTLIGTTAAMDFYTAAGDIPTTGMLNPSTRVKLSNSGPMVITTLSADPSGTRCNGAFNAFTTGVVQTAGTAAFFAILNTTAASPGTANVMFAGTVGSATGDLVFNVVNWDAADNVNVTALNFIAPLGTPMA